MSDWIVRLIEQSGYLGVAFLMFLETIFPPIPSEVIMSIAGRRRRPGQAQLSAGSSQRAPPARCSATSCGTSPPARSASMRLKPIILRWGRWITMSWARGGARRALVRRARHLLRLPRPAAADGAQPGLGPRRPAQDALPPLPASPRPLGTAGWTALLAGAGYKLGENYTDIDKICSARRRTRSWSCSSPAISTASGPTATCRSPTTRRKPDVIKSDLAQARGWAWR